MVFLKQIGLPYGPTNMAEHGHHNRIRYKKHVATFHRFPPVPSTGSKPVGKRWRPTRSESPAGDVFGVRMCTCTNGGVLVGFRK